MKKNITICLLFLSNFLAIAQEQGNVSLNWTAKKELSYGSFSYMVPQFNTQNYEFNDYSKTVSYSLTIPLSNKVNENAIQITNLVFEPILESQLGDIAVQNLPPSFKSSFKSYNAREKYYGKITLTPIVKEGNSFKKLISFSYSVQQNASKALTSFNNLTAIENSVLSSGNWYRFYVQKSGVYKITKSFLQSLGLDTNADPRKIKIYGNGGRMLPLLNSDEYPMDLSENAIQVIGESDGVFDGQDFILFYAEGLDNWNDDYKSSLNIYANKSYYYVTAQGELGKRIVDMPQLTGSAIPITTFDDYQFHEVDEVNVEKLGRIWFGESFSVDNEQEFKFKFPNIVSSTPIEIKTHLAGVTSTINNFKVESNAQLVGNISLNPGNSSSALVIEKNFSSTSNVSAEDVTIKVTFDNGGVPSSKGYLDYIKIKAKRNLQAFGKQFPFQYDQAASMLGQIGEFQLSNAESISQIWDITDRFNVTKAENATLSLFSFKSSLGEVRKYIAIDNADYYSPLKDSNSKVDNQNLKGTIFNNAQGVWQKIDYLIITPKFF